MTQTKKSQTPSGDVYISVKIVEVSKNVEYANKVLEQIQVPFTKEYKKLVIKWLQTHK